MSQHILLHENKKFLSLFNLIKTQCWKKYLLEKALFSSSPVSTPHPPWKKILRGLEPIWLLWRLRLKISLSYASSAKIKCSIGTSFGSMERRDRALEMTTSGSKPANQLDLLIGDDQEILGVHSRTRTRQLFTLLWGGHGWENGGQMTNLITVSSASFANRRKKASIFVWTVIVSFFSEMHHLTDLKSIFH